jgi:uncharacterized protein (UPF0335 family)
MLQKTNARLKHFADEITRVEDQKAAANEALKDLYEAAKSEGYTPSALRKAIRIHSMDSKKREKHDAEQADLEIYLAQLDGKEIEE